MGALGWTGSTGRGGIGRELGSLGGGNGQKQGALGRCPMGLPCSLGDRGWGLSWGAVGGSLPPPVPPPRSSRSASIRSGPSCGSWHGRRPPTSTPWSKVGRGGCRGEPGGQGGRLGVSGGVRWGGGGGAEGCRGTPNGRSGSPPRPVPRDHRQHRRGPAAGGGRHGGRHQRRPRAQEGRRGLRHGNPPPPPKRGPRLPHTLSSPPSGGPRRSPNPLHPFRGPSSRGTSSFPRQRPPVFPISVPEGPWMEPPTPPRLGVCRCRVSLPPSPRPPSGLPRASRGRTWPRRRPTSS